MMKIRYLTIRNSRLIFILLILVSCAVVPKPPFDVISPEMGIIYGNIKIPKHEVTEIELREFGKFYFPPFIMTPRVMIFKNGNFVAENLKPGSYYIARLVVKKRVYTLVKNDRNAYQRIISVEPGSANYVGSYQIRNIQPGIFTKANFDVITVRAPSERNILKHMFLVTKGTAWQARISKRIKELR